MLTPVYWNSIRTPVPIGYMTTKFDEVLRKYEQMFPKVVKAASIAAAAPPNSKGKALAPASISQMRNGERSFTPEMAQRIGPTVASLVGADEVASRLIVADFMLAAETLPSIGDDEALVVSADGVQIYPSNEIRYVRDDEEASVLASYRGVPTENREIARRMLEMLGDTSREQSIGGKVAGREYTTDGDPLRDARDGK